MFTGLVEELAQVSNIGVATQGATLTLRAKRILCDMAIGDSISVNGICLTVVGMRGDSFDAEAVPETLRKTNLGRLTAGDHVHVERAMPAGGRFGGHIVAGHVDGTGRVTRVETDGVARVIAIKADDDVLKYIVDKGSICVDGVSLTVMQVTASEFTISIIPHTQGVTRLGEAQVGDVVNLECDVIAKYVERLLQFTTHEQPSQKSISIDFLQANGFA